MAIPVKNDWADILKRASSTPAYKNLREFLIEEYRGGIVYPELDHIWEAFHLTPYNDVKVVILGQDPYHGPNQAHGLSFSVQPGVKIPPSLANIYKELQNDLGIPPARHGYLRSWAEQGVLLLNTVLTVRNGQANSHRNQGWEELTDTVIQKLNEREKPMVFILWGSPSIKKRVFIDEQKHTVITSPHPSPLSAHRGFFGSKPFSKANRALERNGMEPINWELPQEV